MKWPTSQIQTTATDQYIISLDPAQLRDWSALAAVRMRYNQATQKFGYDLVNMDRRQKIGYDLIVDWAVNAFNTPAFHVPVPALFLLDATGPGLALKDMLRLKGVRCKPIIITSGQNVIRDGPFIHVGKPRLFGKFMAAFDSGRVRISPAMLIYSTLEKEMVNFRAKLSSSGNAMFEAAPGENDDLLFSLAMAIWYGEEILRGSKV